MKEEMKNTETSVEYIKKNTANENSSFKKTKPKKLMFSSSRAVCGRKKATFIKN